MRFDKWLKWFLAFAYAGLVFSTLAFFFIFMPAITYAPLPLNVSDSSVLKAYAILNPPPAIGPDLAWLFVILPLLLLPLAALLEAAEITTSRKRTSEKVLWLAALFFFTLFTPPVYYFLGRNDLTK